MNAQQTSKLFGCTPQQAEARMRVNLTGLEKMAAKAKATGKKVNNYTHDELFELIAKVKKGWNL
jgi:hypothetical protein